MDQMVINFFVVGFKILPSPFVSERGGSYTRGALTVYTLKPDTLIQERQMPITKKKRRGDHRAGSLCSVCVCACVCSSIRSVGGAAAAVAAAGGGRNGEMRITYTRKWVEGKERGLRFFLILASQESIYQDRAPRTLSRNFFPFFLLKRRRKRGGKKL